MGVDCQSSRKPRHTGVLAILAVSLRGQAAFDKRRWFGFRIVSVVKVNCLGRSRYSETVRFRSVADISAQEEGMTLNVARSPPEGRLLNCTLPPSRSMIIPTMDRPSPAPFSDPLL